MISVFLLIMFALAASDYLYYKIPNWIVLPGIALGIYLTGNWMPALLMFCVTAYIFKKNWWRGGDVKLMTMIGAFLGYSAMIILPLTICLIYLYRNFKKQNAALPVAPFALAAALPFIIATIGIRC